ncbi:MAG: hypothetical protein H7835_09915 [Magnetococcus sp. XQGC-1]
MAWSLIKEETLTRAREKTLSITQTALSNGFRGWILLSYGEIDLRCHIMKSAVKIGLTNAVSACVDRYIAFIHELKKLYEQVAIWGPAGSTSLDSTTELPVVGTELERNYATILFTEMLRQRSGVPVISVLYSTLLENGHTNTHLTGDKVHISHILMPYAIDLVYQQLGVRIDGSNCATDCMRQNISDQVIFSRLEAMGRAWILCDLSVTRHIDGFSIMGPARYDTSNPLMFGYGDKMVGSDHGMDHALTQLGYPIQVDHGSSQYIQVDCDARLLYISCAREQPDVQIHAITSFVNTPQIRTHLTLASLTGMARMATTGTNNRPAKPLAAAQPIAAPDPQAQKRAEEIYTLSCLSRALFMGQGVPRNLQLSLQLATKAAEQDDLPAQYLLGIMYAGGEMTKNDVASYMWSYLASRERPTAKEPQNINFCLSAQKHLMDLEQGMRPCDVEKALSMASAWLAQRAENNGQ